MRQPLAAAIIVSALVLTTSCSPRQTNGSSNVSAALAAANDCNSDGVVNTQDLQVVVNAVLGTANACADVNHDGAVNAQDIQAMLNLILSPAESGAPKWAIQLAGKEYYEVAGPSSTAFDSASSLIAAGTFVGTVDVGGRMISTAVGFPFGLFLAKYDSSNRAVWATAFGGNSTNGISKIVVDSNGDLVPAAGSFAGTIDLGAGAIRGTAKQSVFVAKFSGADGHLVWGKTYGGVLDTHDAARSVAIDSDGNVVVFGVFQGTVDLGAGPVTSTDGIGGFLLRLSPSTGTTLWAKAFGWMNENLGQGGAISASTNGDTVVVGHFAGSADFGGITHAASGYADLFVAKYDRSGSPRWVRSFGVVGSTVIPGSLAVNATGEIAIGGYYGGDGEVQLGGGAPLPPGGAGVMFLAKYDDSGNHLWSRAESGITSIKSVALDSQGDVYAIGSLSTLVFLDGAFLTAPLGTIDFFVARLDPTGHARWAHRYGGPTDQDGAGAVSVSEGTNEVALAGSYSAVIDFGDPVGALTPPVGAPSEGFLLKLNR